MTTLLVGATGLLGSEIARRLTNQGRSVRALVRTTADPAKIETLKKLGCALVYGDLRDRASLEAAWVGTATLHWGRGFAATEGGSSEVVSYHRPRTPFASTPAFLRLLPTVRINRVSVNRFIPAN